MIIGLTGSNGSGKTVVSEYLKSRGFAYYSLSDEIREEIAKRGWEATREILIEMGNELRVRFGPGILAEKVLQRMEEDRNYVVDSIRNPAEVEVLRRRKDFTLLALEADQTIRFERSRIRGRESAAQSLERFVEEEARELESADPAAQQLLATRRLADVVVANNGTLEELYRQLDELSLA